MNIGGFYCLVWLYLTLTNVGTADGVNGGEINIDFVGSIGGEGAEETNNMKESHCW